MSADRKDFSPLKDVFPNSIVDCFEDIFLASGEPLPEPEMRLNTGYYGARPEDENRPSYWVDFKGKLIAANAYIRPRQREEVAEVYKHGKKWAERSRQADEWKALVAGQNGLLVEASDGKFDDLRGLFDRETLWKIIRGQFSFERPDLRYDLQLSLPGDESLQIVYPLEVEGKTIRVPFIYNQLVKRSQDPRAAAFAKAVLRYLEPAWERFCPNPHSNEICHYNVTLLRRLAGLA